MFPPKSRIPDSHPMNSKMALRLHLDNKIPRKAPSPPALCTQVGRTLHARLFTHKINTPISCPVYPHEAEETRKC